MRFLLPCILSGDSNLYSRKLTKRLEDLTQESSALKSHLVPQLQVLTNEVPEIVNFGFNLARQIMPHLTEVRSSKTPLQLTTVLSFVKDCAASTIGKSYKDKDGPVAWGSVEEFFTKVGQEVNKLTQSASESENVIKSKYRLSPLVYWY